MWRKRGDVLTSAVCQSLVAMGSAAGDREPTFLSGARSVVQRQRTMLIFWWKILD
jgi:hypothetical protein